MAWNNDKKGKKGSSKRKKAQEKAAKKILKAIFGKTLPLFMLLVLLLGVACALFYPQSEAFRDFLHNNGIYTTTTTAVRAPTIDPNGEELAIHYLDVGQGDSTLLQTADGAVLIDCSTDEYGDDILAYLESENIIELEYLILTHAHDDHMGAAPEILEGIEVENIILSDYHPANQKFYRETYELAIEKNINIIYTDPGDIFEVGALRLRVLGPFDETLSPKGDENDSSIIIHATYGNRAFLFTGDAELEAEEAFLDVYGNQVDSDILQAGHHGSDTSNSQELIDCSTPEYVIISVGEGNSYGHPKAEVLERFEDAGVIILRTDILSTIVFITNGEALTRVE